MMHIRVEKDGRFQEIHTLTQGSFIDMQGLLNMSDFNERNLEKDKTIIHKI